MCVRRRNARVTFVAYVTIPLKNRFSRINRLPPGDGRTTDEVVASRDRNRQTQTTKTGPYSNIIVNIALDNR